MTRKSFLRDVFRYLLLGTWIFHIIKVGYTRRQVAPCVVLQNKSLRQGACSVHTQRIWKGGNVNYFSNLIWRKYMTLSHWLMNILSQRLVAEVYTRCDNVKAAFAHFVAAISRTNSNWFEFVRLTAVPKFCQSDKECCKYAPCYLLNWLDKTISGSMVNLILFYHCLNKW